MLINYGKAALTFQLFIAAIILSSCNNQQNKQQLDDFKSYVQQHRDSAEFYTDQSWASLDSGFNARKEKLDKDYEKMNDSMKAEYDRTVSDWTRYQTEYTRRADDKRRMSLTDSLRKSLAMQGVRPDFSDVTPDNIVDTYTYFVNTVRTNKDNYTQEQWTVINVSYKSLNGRRREIEKDLHKGDEGKIIKLQLDYTGIKAANRPEAPSES